MHNRVLTLAIVTIFIFGAIGAYAAISETAQPTAKPMEKTKDRASRAMNNMFYGPTEVPENLNESATKGTAVDRCSAKTRSGVERGIARLVGGAWQLATFWYSDPGCVTSTKVSTSTKAAK